MAYHGSNSKLNTGYARTKTPINQRRRDRGLADFTDNRNASIGDRPRARDATL